MNHASAAIAAESAGSPQRSALALVGPVWPYRGGIAQYNTRLRQALLELPAAVLSISFRRQYPAWLYPGKGDIEPGASGQRTPGVEYLLDPFSPASWRRAGDRIIEAGCRQAIFHWWTLFWAPAFALMARRLRRHGVRVAFLCHNLADHDARGLKARLSRWMLSQADAYIVHAGDQAGELAAARPGTPVLQRLHPIYDQFPAAATSLPARGRLEVLFFGFIRPYKGLDVLLEALQRLDDPDLYATVVGESWSDADAATIDRCRERLGARLEARLEYVDDQAAAAYFARADLVVLPYLSATGSGVVSLAYRYGKPVLASAVGGLKDAVVDGSTGWLVQPGSVPALAAALGRLDRNRTAAARPEIEAFVQRNGWNAFAQELHRFVAGPGGSRTTPEQEPAR